LHNISLRHLLTHRYLSSFNYLLSLLIVEHQVSELVLDVLGDILTFFNVSYNLAEDPIVGDDLAELGEVPREPLLEAHHERVDVLVHGLDERDRLDDGLVLAVHVGRALLARVLMGQTQLGASQVLIRQLLHQLWQVCTHSSDQFFNGLVVGGGDACVREDLRAQLGFSDAEQELLLL
jgi:hypothetical protein